MPRQQRRVAAALLFQQQDNRILVFSKSRLNGTPRRWNPRSDAGLLDQLFGFRFGQQRHRVSSEKLRRDGSAASPCRPSTEIARLVSLLTAQTRPLAEYRQDDADIPAARRGARRSDTACSSAC